MKERLPTWLPVAALLLPVLAHAASMNPLPPETRLTAVSSAPAPTEETFSVTTATDLTATFTDLQVPAALTGASVVVTQGATIVGTVTLAPPATTATVSLPGAVGQYTLRVIGTPNASFNYGTFSVCVAPTKTPTACIQSSSIVGNVTVQSAPAAPTISSTATPLVVTTQGDYTFTYGDDQFPVALAAAPTLALLQGSNPIAAPVLASPATLTLSPGTYTLYAVAQADSTAKAGLYSVTISGPMGVTPLLDAAFPVGQLSAASQGSNPSAQNLTLSVTDFGFPAALGSASAAVTAGGTVLGLAAAGTPLTVAAPAAALQVWTYATPGSSAGTYEVDLTSTAGSIVQAAYGVDNGSALAYAYVTPTPLAAGDFQLTANDFQFPAALQGLQFAVAQGGALLKTAGTAGTVSFTAPAALPAVVLVDATTPTNGNGMFDVNIQTSGASPQIVFDRTQGVSATGVFTSQTLHLTTAGNFDVTVSDLKFPAQFSNLALVVSNDGAVLGKIYGGGTFTIPATPGDYLVNFIAQPGGTPAQYGLFGLQVVNSTPVVTLTASPTTVVTGATTKLTWTTTNATACMASGGAFTGSQAVSGSASVAVSATTTYTLDCTGPGGSGSGSAIVTATAPPAGSSHGGGSLDLWVLGILGVLASIRLTTMPRHGRR